MTSLERGEENRGEGHLLNNTNVACLEGSCGASYTSPEELLATHFCSCCLPLTPGHPQFAGRATTVCSELCLQAYLRGGGGGLLATGTYGAVGSDITGAKKRGPGGLPIKHHQCVLSPCHRHMPPGHSPLVTPSDAPEGGRQKLLAVRVGREEMDLDFVRCPV